MPRVKSEKQALINIDNFEQADTTLRDIGDLQMQVKQAETTAKEVIDEAKAELAESIKPISEQIKNKVKSLEAFCIHHKKEFGDQKSKKLNFGSIGWRLSTSIEIGKDTLCYIKKIFSGKALAELVRIKETVNKEAIAKLTDGQLADIEAQRVRKDTFFAEPDLPKAVDYGE
jgi:phage host-nuclease inhibitor protein Gam